MSQAHTSVAVAAAISTAHRPLPHQELPLRTPRSPMSQSMSMKAAYMMTDQVTMMRIGTPPTRGPSVPVYLYLPKNQP